MKQCPVCGTEIDASEVYCSEACRAESARIMTEKRPKKPRKCINRKCHNRVSLSIDSPYCLECYLSYELIKGDLRKMKRMSNAKD